MSEARRWWVIRVENYGSFACYGTEDEAEETRAAKAEWEGGVGMKRAAVPGDEDDARLIEDQKGRWRDDLAGGVELEPNELEAIGA